MDPLEFRKGLAQIVVSVRATRHNQNGTEFGLWVSVFKGRTQLPPEVTDKRRALKPIGLRSPSDPDDPPTILVVLSAPKGCVRIPELVEELPTSVWERKPQPIYWCGVGSARKEGQEGLRVYLPKNVMLSMLRLSDFPSYLHRSANVWSSGGWLILEIPLGIQCCTPIPQPRTAAQSESEPEPESEEV